MVSHGLFEHKIPFMAQDGELAVADMQPFDGIELNTAYRTRGTDRGSGDR
jgi:hypothetical protein